MKKRIITFLVAAMSVALVATSCSVLNGMLNQVSSVANLVNCTYNLKNVQNVYVAGVNVKNITNGNIAAADVLKLSSALLKKQVPLTMDLNINVTNPTSNNAVLNVIDWICEIDGQQFASGTSTANRSITPNATTAVPLSVKTDLYSMFSQNGISALKNFVGSFTADGTSSKVAVKIKPSINVGGVSIPAPDYIKLQKTTGNTSTTTGSTSISKGGKK